jgi:hypothetical protein
MPLYAVQVSKISRTTTFINVRAESRKKALEIAPVEAQKMTFPDGGVTTWFADHASEIDE